MVNKCSRSCRVRYLRLTKHYFCFTKFYHAYNKYIIVFPSLLGLCVVISGRDAYNFPEDDLSRQQFLDIVVFPSLLGEIHIISLKQFLVVYMLAIFYENYYHRFLRRTIAILLRRFGNLVIYGTRLGIFSLLCPLCTCGALQEMCALISQLSYGENTAESTLDFGIPLVISIKAFPMCYHLWYFWFPLCMSRHSSDIS